MSSLNSSSFCAARANPHDLDPNNMAPTPSRDTAMTFQKMTNDLIDYRQGTITMQQLRERYATWAVKPAEAKFCVNAAINAGKVK